MTAEGNRFPPTSSYYLWRGSLYAILSAAALLAGYLIIDVQHDSNDLLLLGVLGGPAWCFFVAYSSVFVRVSDENPKEPRSTFFIVLGSGYVVSLACAAFYRISTNAWPSWTILTALLGEGGLFNLYGIYLLFYFQKRSSQRVRHQLVWPIALAVGFTLYTGFMLPTLASTLRPLIPLGAFLCLPILAEFFAPTKLKVLLMSGLFAFGGLLIIIFLDTLSHDFLIFLSCVCVAAYLAVFEAWSVTSDEARLSTSARLGLGTSVRRYYNATFLALILSALAIPSVYIYTQRSYVLLALFGVHSTAAFVWWLSAAKDHHLLTKNWLHRKNAFGTIALAIIVIDSRLVHANLTPVRGPLQAATFAAIFGLTAFFFGGNRLQKVLDDWRDGGIDGLLANPLRFVGIAMFLATLGVVGSIIIFLSPDNAAPVTTRASHACLLYLVYWFSAFAYIAVDFFKTRPPRSSATATLPNLFAWLLLFRMFTSGVIGLACVAVGFLASQSIWIAIRDALPFMLAAMAGFALNDWHDVEKDRINRPYRPLPSGRITTRAALLSGAILFVASMAAAVLATQTPYEAVIYFATIAGSAAYSAIVSQAALVKGVLTGVMCSAPLWLFVTRADISPLLPLSIVVYVAGREVLMDIVDQNGDRAAGIRTIPLILGENVASAIGFLLMTGGAIMALKWMASWALGIAGIAIILTSLGTWLLHNGGLRKRVIYLLWGPMICGAADLITSAFG